MSSRQFVFLSVLVSIWIHFTMWLGIQLLPPFDAAKMQKKSDSVDFTVVTKKEEDKAAKELKSKIVVRQALPPLDQLKPEPPKDPKYLSENDQDVVRETQAKLPGLTQNRNETVTTLPNGPEGSQHAGAPATAQSEDGFGPKNPKLAGNNDDNRLRDLGNQLFQLQSTSGEYLPEVSEGPITALNTERFIYYSFFSRIEERIRPLWERNVRDAQLRLPMSVQKQVLNHDWITSLEILIDDKGNYEATFVKNTCGVDEIDRAAIQSFSEAAYFPNPPKGMIEKDGRIHLKYSFVVLGTTSAWAGGHTPDSN